MLIFDKAAKVVMIVNLPMIEDAEVMKAVLFIFEKEKNEERR
jgi:hypothetical protein